MTVKESKLGQEKDEIMENKGLVIKDALEGIEKSKAEQIESTFAPMVEMLKGFESAYNEVIGLDQEDPETAKKAKRLRLDIAHVRIDTGKIKDKQKEYIKLEDKAIMGVHNIIVWAVKQKEDILNEIETFQERKEAEAKDLIRRTRIESLAELGIDGNGLNLGEMQDDVWTIYLNGKKSEQAALVEAERKAEANRKAEEKAKIAENKRIREENEALKRQQEAERVIREKEQHDREAKEKIEQEAREKEQAKKDAELRSEREKREKAEQEAKAARDLIAKEKFDREQAEIDANRKAAAAGDNEKIQTILNFMDNYDMDSQHAKEALCSARIALRRGLK